MKITKQIFPIEEIDAVYDSVFAKARSVALPSGCLDLVTYIVSELFANIKEHSFASKAEIKFDINHFFYFFVSDNGIGVRKSFLKNGIFAKDDRAAIQLAIGGISAKKKNERAFGLFTTQRIAEYTGGKMEIQTGECKAMFEKNKMIFKANKTIKKGVTVILEIPLKKINLYEILF